MEEEEDLSETLLDEEHELLLALVGHFHVFDELSELQRSVVRQQERFARFGQKVDEVAVVARADVRQTRVGRVHVGRYRRVQQRFQRSLVVGKRFGAAPLGVGGTGGSDTGRRHGTASQDVRQDGGALDVLHQQRDDGAQLGFAQRVAQGARPVNVGDGRMSVLIVGQVDVFHGQESEFVGAVRVAAVLHVAGDGEQLHRRHDVRRRVDHDLIGRFERDGIALAQVQRVQRTVRRVFGGAL